MLADQGAVFNFSVRGQRANVEAIPLLAYAPQLIQARDVNHQFRLGQAHVQRGQQGLSTRQNSGVIPVGLKQIEELGHRGGLDVIKCSGFHG